MFGTDALPGLAPGLLVTTTAGWHPATTWSTAPGCPSSCAPPRRRWGGTPHACAALAWKSYSYWLALPAVLGWASARRVPLLDPADVLIHFEDHRPLVTIGLRRSTTVAVLPGDPLASPDSPGSGWSPTRRSCSVSCGATLLDAHLAPMTAAIHAQGAGGHPYPARLGGVRRGVRRAAGGGRRCRARRRETIDTLLGALGMADLVELVPGRGGEPTCSARPAAWRSPCPARRSARAAASARPDRPGPLRTRERPDVPAPDPTGPGGGDAGQRGHRPAQRVGLRVRGRGSPHRPASSAGRSTAARRSAAVIGGMVPVRAIPPKKLLVGRYGAVNRAASGSGRPGRVSGARK